ncbi:heme ABC transporter ATP-binding protein [Kiloniella laminariae]|uniref:Heme ABC transporter ATP-binding protein n=1 Tax=Kiloniella laminariae TaxID=454162 RepID=A0ABT4LM72_9PROT|nr:heme ABC transporter ATP-binding protein [Kiloniella laminariae]MCZ4282198.1 heme ABC transporter ATP-binding protein [Kiloniella laminariae]
MTLSVKDVSVVIGATTLLQNVTLDLIPGQFLGILGPNGAGKSTFLKVLSGELSPSHGTVTLDGIPLKVWKDEALARRRAVMPQASQLAFPFSARAVVAMGRWPYETLSSSFQNHRVIERAMAIADIRHLGKRSYPVLSGGEKQRVQLARALAQSFGTEDETDSKYLLLDEPTAGLDIAHQHAVLKAARDQSKNYGTASMAVLHDLNQAALYCDQVALISNGRLVASGATAEVMEPARLSRIFGCTIKRQAQQVKEALSFTSSL